MGITNIIMNVCVFINVRHVVTTKHNKSDEKYCFSFN